MASGGDSHNLWGNSPDDLWKKVLDEVSSESRRRKSAPADRGSDEDRVKDLELLAKILKVVKAEKDATVAALDKIYESVGSDGGKVDAASSIDPAVLDEIKRAIISLSKQNQPDKHAEQLKRLADHVEAISKRVDAQAEQVEIAQQLAKSGSSEPAIDPNTITQPLMEAIGKLESRLESLAAEQAARAEQADSGNAGTLEDDGAAEQLAREAREAMAGISRQLNDLQQRVEQFATTAAAASSASATSAESGASASVNNELLYQILDQTKALSEQAQTSEATDQVAPDFAGIEAKLDNLIASMTQVNAGATEADTKTSAQLEAIQGQLSDLAAKQSEIQEDQLAPTEPATPTASQESVDSLREALDAQRERSETGFAQMLDQLTKPPTQAPTAKLDAQQFDELREAVRTKPSTDDQLLTEMLGTVATNQADQKETLAAINARLEQVSEAAQDAATAAREDHGSRDLLQQIHDSVQAMAAREAEALLADQSGETGEKGAESEAVAAELASLRELIAKQGEGADQSSLLYEVLASVRSLAQKHDDSDASTTNAAMLSRLDAIEQSIVASTANTTAASDAKSELNAVSAAAAEQKAMLEQILEVISTPVEKDDTVDTIDTVAAAAAEAVAKVSAKLDGIESKIESLSQQQPEDANVLNEILKAVQTSSAPAVDNSVDPDAMAAQKAMLERIEQSLQSLAEVNTAESQSNAATNNAILQNILDAVETSKQGPVTKDVLDSMRNELAARNDVMAKEIRESLSSISSKNETYDTMLLEILAGVNEATEAGRATDQKALLKQIADAVESKPEREAEQSDRVLNELRALVDTSKLNQKTFERVLNALETNTKAMSATASISASQAGSDSPQQFSYTAWSDRKQKDRTPMFVVVAVAAVLAVVVGLTIYNTVILNRTQDSFNQTANQNDGQGSGQGSGKDQLASKDAISKDSKSLKNNSGTKDASSNVNNVNKDGKQTVNKDGNVSKDGGAVVSKDGAVGTGTKDGKVEPAPTKDGNTVATKDSKQPFNPFKSGDGKGDVGKDGKATPTVPKPIIDAIAKETQNNNNNSAGTNDDLKPIKLADAKQIVFLVHVSGNASKIMPVLLGELNRTIGQLDENQRFTVVFSEGQRAIEVPPAGLKEGTNRNKEWVAGWMDVTTGETGVRPASSPYTALESAMAYKPDLLWVFSDSMAGDQPGQVKPDALLAKLKTLNVDRKTHLNATQCVTKDAANTLKSATDQHGGTFNFVDAEEAASAGRP